MRLMFFDTETTGLPNQIPDGCGQTHNDNGYPKMIQIGWIVTDGDDVVSEHSHLIKPDGFVIPPDAERINGITTEQATAQGEPLETVLGAFIGDLGFCEAFVGHNIGYDINVIAGELARLRYHKVAEMVSSMKCIDTMLSSVEFCAIPFPPDKPRRYDTGSEYKYPKLMQLYEKLFGCGFNGAHDALEDIKATRRCYLELVKRGVI